jgi:hypothetical protein
MYICCYLLTMYPYYTIRMYLSPRTQSPVHLLSPQAIHMTNTKATPSISSLYTTYIVLLFLGAGLLLHMYLNFKYS